MILGLQFLVLFHLRIHTLANYFSKNLLPLSPLFADAVWLPRERYEESFLPYGPSFPKGSLPSSGYPDFLKIPLWIFFSFGLLTIQQFRVLLLRHTHFRGLARRFDCAAILFKDCALVWPMVDTVLIGEELHLFVVVIRYKNRPQIHSESVVCFVSLSEKTTPG